MKRILLLVIDALTEPLLTKEMENGRYPNFKKLTEAGYYQECVSIFPSITHAALTSIVTGEYPSKHGIIASHWIHSYSSLSSSLLVTIRKAKC